MLYIIRHGKTDWNVRHKMQGRTDIPLNEEGRQMAEAAREEYRLRSCSGAGTFLSCRTTG